MAGTVNKGKFNCDHFKCIHAKSLYNILKNTSKKSDLPLEDIDMEHVYQDHLRLCCDYYIGQTEKLENNINEKNSVITRLTAEKNKLTALNVDLAKAFNKPKQNNIEPQVVRQVDPRNHVDDFCDACLVAKDGSVCKCTEYASYGSNVCSLHKNHATVIVIAKREVTQKSEQEIAQTVKPVTAQSPVQTFAQAVSQSPKQATEQVPARQTTEIQLPDNISENLNDYESSDWRIKPNKISRRKAKKNSANIENENFNEN